MEARCAFCGGTGKDPFGLLSPLSSCQVCAGRGWVYLPEAGVTCAFCRGRGVYPHTRLTCTVCSGKGRLAFSGRATTCRRCAGRGMEPASGLPCLACRGYGVVKGGRAFVHSSSNGFTA